MISTEQGADYRPGFIQVLFFTPQVSFKKITIELKQ